MPNVGLTQLVTPQKIEYSGFLDIPVYAGQTFKIETSPDGEDHIIGTVPEGKTWRVTAPVHIQESSE